MNHPGSTRPAWLGLLFPVESRSFPFRRSVRLLRTGHILAAGTLLGGVIFQQPWTALQPWWIAMLATGLALLATDLYASCGYLVQVSGLTVVLKMGLSALAGWYPQAALPLLLVALVIGSISSHMPGRYRHLAPPAARGLLARSGRG